jgi:hypothetical protein
MIAMGKAFLPSNLIFLITIKKFKKLKISTIHLGNKKVGTFVPYIGVPLKATNPTNQPSNVFHLATRL